MYPPSPRKVGCRLRQGLLALLLVALSFNTPAARAVIIGFEPGAILANTGDAISLDLVISGLADFGPDSLGAFDISVGFDPAALTFTGYSLGNFLGDTGLFEAIDASAGLSGASVNLAQVSLLSAVSLDALQPGAFTLATLNFDVANLASGQVTQISLLPGPTLADANGDRLSATLGEPVSVAGIKASVPEPGTAFLFMVSLAGWLMSKRRRGTPPALAQHH